MEYSTAETLLTSKVREEGFGSKARGYYKLASQDFCFVSRWRLDIQYPAAPFRILMFRGEDFGIMADQVDNAKLGCIGLQVCVNNGTRDVLILLDAERRSAHGEVRVLICPQKVVAFQPWIEPFVSPGSAQRGLSVEYRQRCIWTRAAILLGYA